MLRYALALLSSLKKSDAFTVETGDNSVLGEGRFVPVVFVPLAGMNAPSTCLLRTLDPTISLCEMDSTL